MKTEHDDDTFYDKVIDEFSKKKKKKSKETKNWIDLKINFTNLFVNFIIFSP